MDAAKTYYVNLKAETYIYFQGNH